ncbi:copper ion binding protein [Ammoniphilus sp. 3BR4]|uniref:copper ion binding protein n=1 Tax=Ammoniphilus sp. 3BR4 TaxID=3158265 RepID=UPI003467DC45
MKAVTLNVEGMSCGHCVAAIEGSLKKELDIVAKVDLGAKTVSLEFDENKVSLEKIKDVIEDQGYDVK